MDKFYGIIKGGKHSYNDFGLKIISRELNPPSKNKVKETIPFMNGSYDFSSLYGENTYGERKIKYVFDFRYNNKIEFISKKIAITNWLNSGFKEPLYDDLIPGYYFIAECEDSIDFSEGYIDCEVAVTFTAYPFKICNVYEGDIAWDDFNFELDVLQETKFDINGVKNVKIYNVGATSIVPEVICSSISGVMEVTKNNIIYKFNSGTSKDFVFELGIGQNDMTIKGNGTIEFRFRKEVL